jgi:ribonuclease HI
MLLKKAGFHLTQWLSSSRKFLSQFPSIDLISPKLNLDLDKLPVERTLGILYNPEKDVLCFKVKINADSGTKRALLSAISSIHDPLGFLSPVTIIARRLLQETWMSKSGWDDPIDPELLSTWRQWTHQLSNLENLEIPRPSTKFKVKYVDLHAFADASESAFGAVLYIRFKDFESELFHVSFLASKARVAPVKPLTIPRLELQAAVLALRLAASFAEILEFNITQTTYWSDSQTVLQWIGSRRNKFHTFVGNRIGEIREGSMVNQWRHVPGVDNPADDCSRGINPSGLSANHRWFTGPHFLTLPSDQWPEVFHAEEPALSDPELKVPTWIGALRRNTPRPVSNLIERSSNL